jgi:Zn-dependent protease
MPWAKRLLDVSVQATPWTVLSVGFLLGALTLLLGSATGPMVTFLFFASLMVHELAHVMVALANGVQVTAVGFCAVGTYIRRRQSESPWVELAISSAGPTANFLLFMLFRQGQGQLCGWLAVMNLVLAVSNLIPITGTDGARAFNATRRGLMARPLRAAKL